MGSFLNDDCYVCKKIMIILHFLIGKILKVYDIFARSILVAINIVECIGETPNDILDVKIGGP